MTKTGLVVVAVALVAAGVALGWMASRREVVPAGTTSAQDPAAEIAALRTAADEQAARLRRVLNRQGAAEEAARIEAAMREQAARIEKLESAAPPQEAAGPATSDAGAKTKAVLEDLKVLTDGSKTVAIHDALATIVRAGDAAVPGVVALLQSGFDRPYGAGLSMKGNVVANYPNLRLVLMDALRQIGTPAARDGLLQVLRTSDRPSDCPVVWMFWEGGFTDPADARIVSGLSALTTASLRKVAAVGLEASDCETSNGPVVSIVFWIARHPVADDAADLYQIVSNGRPKDIYAAELYTKFVPVLVEVAPEKAAKAVGATPGYGLVSLAEQFGEVSKASQARYYEALFAQGGMDANVRFEMYSRMTWLDDRIKDPAQRVADAQPIVRFLEARVNAETDAVGKAGAEKALQRLREVIEQVREQ